MVHYYYEERGLMRRNRLLDVNDKVGISSHGYILIASEDSRSKDKSSEKGPSYTI